MVGDSDIRKQPSLALSPAAASLHEEPVLREMRKQRLLAGKGPEGRKCPVNPWALESRTDGLDWFGKDWRGCAQAGVGGGELEHFRFAQVDRNSFIFFGRHPSHLHHAGGAMPQPPSPLAPAHGSPEVTRDWPLPLLSVVSLSLAPPSEAGGRSFQAGKS